MSLVEAAAGPVALRVGESTEHFTATELAQLFETKIREFNT